ncbi:MAG: hypothetical protein HY049_13475 [Acidobacteria bacterium]|nr:hypothetical protein [Acidobacteriota bacterium]
MRRALVLVVTGWIVCALGAPVLAEGNANFVVGRRSMTNRDYWGDFDRQTLAGVTVDFGRATWPIHLETGHQESMRRDRHGLKRADVVEDNSFGVNKSWGSGETSVHPFVGGGVSLVTTFQGLGPFGGGTIYSQDRSKGAYAHGGAFWRRGARLNLGVDARVRSGSSIHFLGRRGNAQYAQVSFLIGWGWPTTK